MLSSLKGEMKLAPWQLWLVRSAVLCTIAALAVSVLPMFQATRLMNVSYGPYDALLVMLPSVLISLLALIGLSPLRRNAPPARGNLWEGYIFSLGVPFLIAGTIGGISEAPEFPSFITFNTLVLLLLILPLLLVLVAMHPWQSVTPVMHYKGDAQRQPNRIFWVIGVGVLLWLLLYLLTQLPHIARLLSVYSLDVGNHAWTRPPVVLAVFSVGIYLPWWRWRFWGSFASLIFRKTSSVENGGGALC